MPRITLNLDALPYHKLTRRAIHHRRPIRWEAEVILLNALLGCADASALQDPLPSPTERDFAEDDCAPPSR